MNKMADKDIIKALKLCSHCVCNDDKTETECPLYNMSFCKNYLRKQSLDLINQQQKTIERLKEEVASKSLKYSLLEREKAENILGFVDDLKLVRAEAVKEFAEKYEKVLLSMLITATLEKKEVIYSCLDTLEEMAGKER